ncbi:MAG: serine/threonine-protein kinase [Terracidiphilus sp.]|nr:serine/threonine-protein kinase [Terracidiphilus sp.]
MPNDSKLDRQRVLEALRRGWIRQAQADQCIRQDQPEQDQPESVRESAVDALFRGGLLTEEQRSELLRFEGDAGNSGLKLATTEAPERASEPVEADGQLRAGDYIRSRYRILQVFQSGFERTYLCTDTSNGQKCVLKTFARDSLSTAQQQEKFREEMLLWIGLGEHPNIVLAYGMEECMGFPFVVVEHVEGGSLADRLAQGALGWEAAAGFGWQIANGLEYVGNVCGVLHCDLKPEKVLLTGEGIAKITDFGILQAHGSRDGLRDGASRRTPFYMPPEEWTNPAETDMRSDVYAFGVTLFELATGKLPFKGSTLESLREAHLTQQPLDPRQFQPKMPTSMAQLILRCMEKRPKDRPADFSTVRRALVPFAGPQHQMPSIALSRVGGLVNQSGTYHRQGRLEDAERTARNAVQLDAKNIKARIALANALAARRAYPQAFGHLEEAYRLDPASAAPIVNSALYASQSGDNGRAARWLDIALETLPPRQLENLATLMMDLGRIQQAIEVCEAVVQEDPAAIAAWNSLSIAWRRSGELEKALSCADHTIQLNARYARGWSNRATILVQLGKFAEAITAADRAIQLAPATAGAYAAKAAALGQTGHRKEGCTCIQAGLAALPGNELLERALLQFK